MTAQAHDQLALDALLASDLATAADRTGPGRGAAPRPARPRGHGVQPGGVRGARADDAAAGARRPADGRGRPCPPARRRRGLAVRAADARAARARSSGRPLPTTTPRSPRARCWSPSRPSTWRSGRPACQARAESGIPRTVRAGPVRRDDERRPPRQRREPAVGARAAGESGGGVDVGGEQVGRDDGDGEQPRATGLAGAGVEDVCAAGRASRTWRRRPRAVRGSRGVGSGRGGPRCRPSRRGCRRGCSRARCRRRRREHVVRRQRAPQQLAGPLHRPALDQSGRLEQPLAARAVGQPAVEPALGTVAGLLAQPRHLADVRGGVGDGELAAADPADDAVRLPGAEGRVRRRAGRGRRGPTAAATSGSVRARGPRTWMLTGIPITCSTWTKRSFTGGPGRSRTAGTGCSRRSSRSRRRRRRSARSAPAPPPG